MTDGHEKALTTRAGASPTIGELFRARALIHKSSVAIEYQGRQISYGQLLTVYIGQPRCWRAKIFDEATA